MYLLGVFGGALWLIPLAALVGAVISFYKANKYWKSGSLTKVDKRFGEVEYIPSDKRVKFFSIAAAKFGIAFAVILLICIIAMIADK